MTPGPQYHPVTCLLYNPLDSKAHVEYSAAGVNGADHGTTTYGPGHFSQAMIVDANGEGADFYDPTLMLQAAGTWSLWVKPIGWSIANGVPSDGQTHIIVENTDLTAGLNQAILNFQPTGIRWFLRTGAGTIAPIVWTPVGMNAADGSWHQIAFVWNATGIPGTGGMTRQIYWDDVALMSDNVALVPFPVFSFLHPFSLGVRNQGLVYTFPFKGALDNVKVFDYAKTDFSDNTIEGFVPAAPVVDFPPEILPINVPRIEIAGQNIVCRANETPLIKEDRSIQTDLSVPAECEITVRNFDSAFSLENKRSILYGSRWQNEPVVVYDRFQRKIWDGVLSAAGVDEGSRSSVLASKSITHKWRKQTITYGGGAETPASALRNVAALIGMTNLDPSSLSKSDDQQTAAGILITVTIASSDDVKFSEFINKMADYGVADVYEHLGKIYYVYYDGAAGSPVVTLDEDDIISTPEFTRETMSLFNDYAIGRAGPVTETDAGNNDVGAISRKINGTFLNDKIPGDVDVLYSPNAAAACIAIGEAHIRRTHVALATEPRPRIVTSFDLPVYHREWVDLQSDFALTYARESWTAKLFRTVGFERNDNTKRITVTGLEWPE